MDQTPKGVPSSGRAAAVPSSRLARVARFGGMASRLAAGVAVQGAGRLARGERPALRDLVLTPGNVTRFADELARMRGAAMKMGQLLSMDAGEFLPRELADILARLRADADHMPPRQLRDVLDAEWGRGWLQRFAKFEAHPMAAASIGQIHRARLPDGRELAIKVQYPGVRRSIDSDVANVGTLIRLSGLMPPGVALAPLLEEAKRQLHDEADYAREAGELARFAAFFAGDPDVTLPQPVPEFSTRNVLAMTFVRGRPVEAMAGAPQAERDHIATVLLDVMLRELFHFGSVQTDPNFANYRYDPETRRVVLLDFGAARDYAPERVALYRAMLLAARSGERAAMRDAAVAVGFLSQDTAAHHVDAVLDMIEVASEPLRRSGAYDFGTSTLVARLSGAGEALAFDPSFEEVPPMEVLYLQRKVAGMYLLANRLGARVDVGALIERRLG
ncbi:MAG: AarF/ABC1/UbiB kinase family protein [Pseudomonadota bacterium]